MNTLWQTFSARWLTVLVLASGFGFVGCAPQLDTEATKNDAFGPTKNQAMADRLAPNALPTVTSQTTQQTISHVRRMSVEEINNSLRAVFGQELTFPSLKPALRDSLGAVMPSSNSLLNHFGKVSSETLKNHPEWSACLQEQGNACVQSLIKAFGQQLWRRPLTHAEVNKINAGFVALSSEHGRTTGLEYVIERMLMSPHFLFILE